MERNMFSRFKHALKRLGTAGVGDPVLSLGRDGKYDLAYIPFEHVNPYAKLVLVGITPGNTQLELAYGEAQNLLNAGRIEEEILVQVKKAGAFGGKSMKPNLLKILRHFQFEQLLGISDVEMLWGSHADLLHSTSVVPHAAFKDGQRFNGSFAEIFATQLLKECFLDCFVSSAREINRNALFVALGPCPQAALEWCVKEGALRREQVLGSFCHPSSAGGSTTGYYLREVSKEELDSKNPVRSRCEWLDRSYEQMHAATSSILKGNPKATVKPITTIPTLASLSSQVAKKTTPRSKSLKSPVPKLASTDVELAIILEAIEKQGFRLTNGTTKLSEFRSPNDQTIYLVKTTSKLNRINFIVHPGLNATALRASDGVESVDPEHRFHSNMSRFPKRVNKGKTETTYGWQVRITSQSDLSRFLTAFKLAE